MNMDKIAIVGKGGGGKTTTVTNLGVVARRAGFKVGFVDADPQGSLRDWRHARASADIPVQTCSAGRLPEVLALAERARLGALFIDMPPAFDAQAISVIGAVDFVILPMRPTILDLGVTRKWIGLLRSAAKPFGVVINAAPPRRERTEAPAVRDARAAVGSLGARLWPGQVTHRLIIPHAAIGGRSVVECDPDGPAAAEYSDLWRAITQFLDINRRSNNVSPSPHAA